MTHARSVQVSTLLGDLEEEFASGTYIDSNGESQDTGALARGLEVATKTASATSAAVATGELKSTGVAIAANGAAKPTKTGPGATPPFVSAASGPSKSQPRTTDSSKAASGPLTLPRRLQSQPLALPHRAAVRAVLSSPCNPIPEDGLIPVPSPPPAPAAETGGDNLPLLRSSSGRAPPSALSRASSISAKMSSKPS